MSMKCGSDGNFYKRVLVVMANIKFSPYIDNIYLGASKNYKSRKVKKTSYNLK
jgi:Tol biopolymer transport system component